MPIALDTNVLVRFLAQDDVEQFEIARDIINSCSAKRPAFICLRVLVKLVWVLEHSYRYSQIKLRPAVMGLVSAAGLQVEAPQYVAEILPLYQNKGFGFSDLMIRQATIRIGGYDLQTFDRKAAKLAGVTLLGTSL